MKILIIGAGPAGLGAANRLRELGFDDWLLIESANQAGGLASSVVDENGFTWDMGGHVLFSHYEYFDNLTDDLLGTDWVDHVRESWVWIRQRFVPYPFQNNIRLLPEEDLQKCLAGLRIVKDPSANFPPPKNFREWLLQHFGQGLADVFMLPYNWKVWAYDLSLLAVNWMGERVAEVNLERILKNIQEGKDDTNWGPNTLFRFPLNGGTGAIWKALFDRLPGENIRIGKRVVEVNAKEHSVTLEDGEKIIYENLISTMPLDLLLKMIPDESALAKKADRFMHSSVHIMGFGFDGRPPENLKTKNWMYFPEDDIPCFRVTVFSNYSPNNVPRPESQWSLLCEVSESPQKPVDSATITKTVLDSLFASGLVPEGTKVVSTWHTRLEYGYPTPFVGREELLEEIQPWLMGHDIYSRGRFGGWRYEVSNQDHALMQGREAADHIVNGEEEQTYFHPDRVNSRKNKY